MSNKKKIILMSSLVLLLAVTAVFNFAFANSTAVSSADGGITTANYFTTYRAERTTTRNEEIVQLDSVIALYEAGDEKYEEATEMKMDLVAAMEKDLFLKTW
jgi:signal transduction histidine kinase